jgi:PEP-CTERM motif
MNRAIKFVAAAAMAVSAAAASAADVNVAYSVNFGDTLSSNATKFDGGLFTITGTSVPTNGGAALEFQLHTTNNKTFAAYCIDAALKYAGNGAQYNVITNTQLDAVARLFAVAGFNGKSYGTDAVDTGVEASALQLAIWEVRYDGLSSNPYGAVDLNAGSTDDDGTADWLKFSDASAGLFRASGFSYDVVSQAAAYLNAAASLSNGSYVPTVQVLNSLEPGTQRLVTSVPEPSTYALLAACLGVVGLATRRKMA